MVSWHDCTLLHSELTQTEVRWFPGMTVPVVTQWIDTEVRWFHSMTVHCYTVNWHRGKMVLWHDCTCCYTVNWLRWRWGGPKIPVVTWWIDGRRWDGFMAWFIDCTCLHSEWTQTVSVEAAQWKWREGWWRCWCCRWKKVGGRGHWTARLESSPPTLWRWWKRAMGSNQVWALLVSTGFLSLSCFSLVPCVVVVDSILLSVCVCLSLFNICHSYFLHNVLL